MSIVVVVRHILILLLLFFVFFCVYVSICAELENVVVKASVLACRII